jgi:pimeloyl-ACP methyl ester carboxylesterase
MRCPASFSILFGIMLAAAGVAVDAHRVDSGSVRDVNRTNSAIAEDQFVLIGGIEQWISIRGDDRANPVILVLHGGPGEAQTPLEVLYKGWEKQFTVVQWDQRGSGKTFGRNGKATPEMTLDRLVQDAVEVADFARQHLGKEKSYCWVIPGARIWA